MVSLYLYNEKSYLSIVLNQLISVLAVFQSEYTWFVDEFDLPLTIVVYKPPFLNMCNKH